MLFNNFDISVQNLGNFNWKITVITPAPENNKFVGQIRAQFLNEEMAFNQIWNEKKFRDQFFLEIVGEKIN